MSSSRLVVRSHQPRRARLFWALGLFAVIAGGIGLYEFGRYQGGYNRVAAGQERQALEAKIADLNAVIAELRQKIAILETSRTVDSKAYSQVEQTLTDLQSQIQEQREELAFYRGIVSPEDGATGLKIQDFSVTPGVQGSQYRLRLVLVQANRHDRRVSGVVSLRVDGARDGQPVTYALSDLVSGPDEAETLEFSFRYFQDFERDVRLPEGFVPDRVTVEVNPKGRRAKVITESYDWAVKSS